MCVCVAQLVFLAELEVQILGTNINKHISTQRPTGLYLFRVPCFLNYGSFNRISLTSTAAFSRQ